MYSTVCIIPAHDVRTHTHIFVYIYIYTYVRMYRTYVLCECNLVCTDLHIFTCKAIKLGEIH